MAGAVFIVFGGVGGQLLLLRAMKMMFHVWRLSNGFVLFSTE